MAAERYLEVIETEDGRFAVREWGGHQLESLSESFDTREAAENYLEQRAVDLDLSANLDFLKPGGGQGLR